MLHRDRIDEARHELFRLLNEKEMKNTKLLILANKIDLPQALQREKVIILNIKRAIAFFYINNH